MTSRQKLTGGACRCACRPRRLSRRAYPRCYHPIARRCGCVMLIGRIPEMEDGGRGLCQAISGRPGRADVCAAGLALFDGKGRCAGLLSEVFISAGVVFIDLGAVLLIMAALGSAAARCFPSRLVLHFRWWFLSLFVSHRCFLDFVIWFPGDFLLRSFSCVGEEVRTYSSFRWTIYILISYKES